MLKTIEQEIKNNYYDPAYHGMELKARFETAQEKINQAASYGQIIGVIAQAVLDLGDSHTMFIPPLRTGMAVYRWRMEMIGDTCYVTTVMAGSDAEAKGLRAGDRILSLDSYEPTRDVLWKMQYYYYVLRPKSRVNLTFRTLEGQERHIEVLTKFHKRHLINEFGLIFDLDPARPDVDEDSSRKPLFAEFGEDLIICKLPNFGISQEAVDKMMKRISGHKALVLDLRDNPGGYVETLDRFIGYFFDHEIKVAELKRRKGTKEVRVKPRKNHLFLGKLIVLVNSNTASAAEAFSRVVQLEKRGVVIGDRTSGSVMEGRRYHYQIEDHGELILYGLHLTDADIIMSDGKSLENVGVIPDELLLPAPGDLRNRRDPVLSHAAMLADVKLEPEKAGDLFLLSDSTVNP